MLMRNVTRALSYPFQMIALTALAAALALPAPASSETYARPGQARAHMAKAAKAAKDGECEVMRSELAEAARHGVSVDPGVAREWGFKCGVPLNDGVYYSMNLTSMSVSESGEAAAAATADGKVFIFDLYESRSVAHWNTGLSEVKSLDFAPDGSMTAAGGDKSVVVFDPRSRREVWRAEMPAFVDQVRFSPDGKALVVGMNKFTGGSDAGINLEGFVSYISLRDPARTVDMKSVSGNPAVLAITADGQRIIGLCWSKRYSFSTVASVRVWDAAQGNLILEREIRSSTMYPAHISRDGKILAYSKLRDEAIDANRKTLDREGRIKDPSKFRTSAWLRDKDSYQAVAQDVFGGGETPIISGKYLLGVDDAGKYAAVIDAKGNALFEEIGVGRVFDVNVESGALDGAEKPLVSIGSGVMVFGATNDELQRFGWLRNEIPSPKKVAGAM